MRGSSDSDLAPRSGDARDSGGIAAAPGVDGYLIALGGLPASRPRIATVRVLEAVQGGQGPAAGALAAHHVDTQAKTVRLIAACLADWPRSPSRPFRTRQTTCSPIGPRWTCRYGHSNVFAEALYERLTVISNRHPYNLRRSGAFVGVLGRPATACPSQALTHTSPKPRQEGRQGWGRADSMHQGDLGKYKGINHINGIDEVTQYQFAGCAECIRERYPLPVLERLLVSLPVVVLGFHSAIKYVNHRLVPLMQELGLEEFATPLRRP